MHAFVVLPLSICKIMFLQVFYYYLFLFKSKIIVYVVLVYVCDLSVNNKKVTKGIGGLFPWDIADYSETLCNMELATIACCGSIFK